jgi:hypothetical protein
MRKGIDRRNYTERSLDDKPVLALIGLVAMPFLWITKTYFGFGAQLFDVARLLVLIFLMNLAVFLGLPGLFFMGKWIIGKFRTCAPVGVVRPHDQRE